MRPHAQCHSRFAGQGDEEPTVQRDKEQRLGTCLQPGKILVWGLRSSGASYSFSPEAPYTYSYRFCTGGWWIPLSRVPKPWLWWLWGLMTSRIRLFPQAHTPQQPFKIFLRYVRSTLLVMLFGIRVCDHARPLALKKMPTSISQET